MSEPGRRVRIGFLGDTHGDWGGASRVLFNTLRALDRQVFEPVVFLPMPGPAEELLRELEIPYRIWGPVREPTAGWVRYARDIVDSLRLIRAERIDLLDVNFNYWRPAEVLAAWLLRIPIITHFHLVDIEPGPFVRLSRLVTVVSEYARIHCRAKGQRVEVIHNMVDLRRFEHPSSLRAELDIGEQDVVVSFLGQIRENKGIDLFLRMARALDAPGVQFLIAGECRDPMRFPGSYSPERLRDEMGPSPRIRYLGYRSDVENIYATSDVIVMPSRWGEPFGLINIEAGASGIPMVATRDGGIPEIIRDGENGFLVDVDDLVAMTAQVRRLIAEPDMRRAMGKRARQMVEEQFTQRPVRKLERLYLEVVGA